MVKKLRDIEEIEAAQLEKNVETQREAEKVSDYLMWVGSIYYPTLDVYIEEAKERGVCKRVGKLPHNLIPGLSKVYLAHNDGINGEGFVFGYFIPSEIQYLAYKEEDVPYQLYDKVHWISDWSEEADRECGERTEGIYVVSMAPGTGVWGEFVVFDKPVSLEKFVPEDNHHFRGMLEIDYGSKLEKAPKSKRVVPPSQSAKGNKSITDDEIVKRVNSGESLSKVAQIIAYETGSKKTQIIYRYNKAVGKIKTTKKGKGRPKKVQPKPKKQLAKSKLKVGK